MWLVAPPGAYGGSWFEIGRAVLRWFGIRYGLACKPYIYYSVTLCNGLARCEPCLEDHFWGHVCLQVRHA